MPASKKAKAAHKKRLQEAEAAVQAEIQLQEALLKKQRPTPETYNTRISNRKPQPQKCSEIFQRIKYLNIIVGFISPAETPSFTHIIKLSHVSSYFREAIIYFAETFWTNAVKVCTDFYPSSLPFPNTALVFYNSGSNDETSNNKDSSGAATIFRRPTFSVRFRTGLGKVLKSPEVGDWIIQAMVYQGKFDINYIFDEDDSKLYEASYLCADYADDNKTKNNSSGNNNNTTISTKYFEKASRNESCKLFLGQAGICKNQQEADLRILERRRLLELDDEKEEIEANPNSFTYSSVGSAKCFVPRGFTCLTYLLNPNRDKNEPSVYQDNGELDLVAWSCIKNLIELGAVINPTLHDISNDNRQFTSDYHYIPAIGSSSQNTNNDTNNNDKNHHGSSPYIATTSTYNFSYKKPPKQIPFRIPPENVTDNSISPQQETATTTTTFSLSSAVKKQFALRLFLERTATPLMEIINPDSISTSLSSSQGKTVHPFIGSIDEHVARIRFVLAEGRGGNSSEKVDVNEYIRVREESYFTGLFNKTRKFWPKPGKKSEAEIQKSLDSICWEYDFHRHFNIVAGNFLRFNALVSACEILTPAPDYAERRLTIVKMLLQEFGAMPQPHLNVVNYYNPKGMLSWEQIYENINRNNKKETPEKAVDVNTFCGNLSELTKFKYLRNPSHRTATLTALSTAINACDLELVSLLLFGDDDNDNNNRNNNDDDAKESAIVVTTLADPNVTNLWTSSPIVQIIEKLRDGYISKSFGGKMISMLIKAGVNCCEMNLKLHFCDGGDAISHPWPLPVVPQSESKNGNDDDDDDDDDDHRGDNGRFSRISQVWVKNYLERSKSRLTWLYAYPATSDCNSVLAAVVCIAAIPQIVRTVLNDGGAWKLFHYARPEWDAIKKYCGDARHHREEFKVILKLLIESESKKL